LLGWNVDHLSLQLVIRQMALLLGYAKVGKDGICPLKQREDNGVREQKVIIVSALISTATLFEPKLGSAYWRHSIPLLGGKKNNQHYLSLTNCTAAPRMWIEGCQVETPEA
jgi:hypothetical protein